MLVIAKKRERTEVRREQIVEAAEKLILASGGENMTIKAIAAAVGITEGAVYRHFESKNEIFSFLLDGIARNWLGELERSLLTGAFIGQGCLVDGLRVTFFRQVSSLTDSFAIALHVIAEVNSLSDRELNQKLRQIIGTFTSGVRNLLALGVKTGEIRRDIDPEAAALLYFGMMQTIGNNWLLHGYDFDPEVKVRPMWEIFERAIAKSEDHIKAY